MRDVRTIAQYNLSYKIIMIGIVVLSKMIQTKANANSKEI